MPKKETVFSIDYYNLEITADSTFSEKKESNFDLQITNGKTYISIMAYKYIDLPEKKKPIDFYYIHIDDLFSRRTAVEIIESSKTRSYTQYEITQTLYSAEKDGIKNYYAIYLIDFQEEETFAWIINSAPPSYLDENRDYLQNIVYSLKIKE